MSKNRKLLGYILTSLQAVVGFVISIALIGMFDDKFESIVMTILVLTYHQVIAGIAVLSQEGASMASIYAEQFILVRRLLKDEEADLEHEGMEELQEGNAYKRNLMLINSTFSFLVILIGIANIITHL